jgi:hypothetical protein
MDGCATFNRSVPLSGFDARSPLCRVQLRPDRVCGRGIPEGMSEVLTGGVLLLASRPSRRLVEVPFLLERILAVPKTAFAQKQPARLPFLNS